MIILSLLVNVLLHESGHYIVAEGFELEPTMQFFDGLYDSEGKVAFDLKRLNSEPLAYTEFNFPNSIMQYIFVTFAGVVANMIFALMILVGYHYTKRTLLKKIIFLSLLVPTIFSIVLNLNIYSQASDGAILFELILQIL